MRHLPFVLLLAACSDYDLNGPDMHDGKYNPPDLGAETNVDNITQVTVPSVDVLWVIDNSGSMAEEQKALRDAFPQFMRYFTDSGLDYHVGVVSTDMDNRNESGKLVQDSSKSSRYVDSTMSEDEAISSFRERATLGINGSSSERGNDAMYAALVTERDKTNAGYYRDEASLSVVIISDEVDQSRISTNEVISFLEQLKPEEGMVTYSSIVGPAPNGCATAERGRGYLEVTEAIGGVTASICDSDWSDLLAELGLQAAGLKREFFLSLVPVEDTIAVTIKDGKDETEYDRGDDWTYDRARNSITFKEVVPDPLTVVSISYEVLASGGAEIETE